MDLFFQALVSIIATICAASLSAKLQKIPEKMRSGPGGQGVTWQDVLVVVIFSLLALFATWTFLWMSNQGPPDCPFNDEVIVVKKEPVPLGESITVTLDVADPRDLQGATFTWSAKRGTTPTIVSEHYTATYTAPSQWYNREVISLDIASNTINCELNKSINLVHTTQPSPMASQSAQITPSPAASTLPDVQSEMVFIANGDFYLDAHEVTNAAYRECVAAGKCDEPQLSRSLTRQKYYDNDNSEFDNYPVIWVNWENAKKYCESIGKRLPTAEEWDSAAQNLKRPSEDEITAPEDTKAVGTTSQDKTAEGVYDLAGNVREWVGTSDKSTNKLVKGKSVSSTPGESISFLPTISDGSIGFRCASDEAP